MIKISAYTLHGLIGTKRLGFVSTHIAREKIFDGLNIPHTILFSDPCLHKSNWTELLEKMGYSKYKNVVLEKSNIARHKPSLTKGEALQLIDNPIDVKEVYYSENGYVAAIELSNEEVIYFTSNIFLWHKDNCADLYDDSGILLSMNLLNGQWSIIEDGIQKNHWDIMIEWLSMNTSQKDYYISDFSSELPMSFRKFFQNTGRVLHVMIHYNILSSKMVFKFPRWATLLTASERLTEQLKKLDITSTFLPPIYVDKVLAKRYESVKKYCLVGANADIKRINMAIDAFQQCFESGQNVSLSIFGGLPDNIKVENLPQNVEYKGFVSEVTYWEYEGYISCSQSECFANAMVEASSNGLVTVVSNVDLAHRFYKSISNDGVYLFDTTEELVDVITMLTNKSVFSPFEIAERYQLNGVIEMYRNIFSNME